MYILYESEVEASILWEDPCSYTGYYGYWCKYLLGESVIFIGVSIYNFASHVPVAVFFYFRWQ